MATALRPVVEPSPAAPTWAAPVAAVPRAVVPLHPVRRRFLDRLPHGARVLDAGCGGCATQRKLLAARPDLRFSGVDVLDMTAACPPGTDFHTLDFEHQPLPFADGVFDGIFFCHVLEHLDNRMNVLSEFARVLKPGGHIYIEGPSLRSLFLPSLSWLPSRPAANAIGDDLSFYDNFTHVRPLSRRGLQMFLQMAGCDCLASGPVRDRRRLWAQPFRLLAGALLRRRRSVCVALWELVGWSVYAVGRKQGDSAC